MTAGFWEVQWTAILRQYGTRVAVFDRRDGPGQEGWALIQPIADKSGPQLLPSPLGGRREDRFLYLGEPGLPLEAGKGGWVECAWGRFSIQSAHPVRVGDAVSHWQAVLRPEDKSEVGE